MTGYIKSMSDFSLLCTVKATDWDIATETDADDSSSVIVPRKQLTAAAEGQWLMIAGALLYIETVTYSGSEATLKCRHLRRAFNRDMQLSIMPAASYLEQFIGLILIQQFRSQIDTRYRLSYITVNYTTRIAYHAPEADSNGVFNFADFLRDCAQNYGVRITWTYSLNTLNLTVTAVAAGSGGSLVLGRGRNTLADAPVFFGGSTAKVTILQTVDGVTASTNYYLYEDGSIGTDSTRSDRVDGAWTLISVNSSATSAEILTKVKTEMSKNANATNIQFYSDKDMAVGGPVYLHVSGRKVRGYITYKGVKKGDDRFVYKVGDHASTVSQRLDENQAAAKSAARSSGTSSGGGSVTYPISIGHGGTGQTSAAAARVALGVPGTPVTIVNGGTGATTAAAALSNLGVDDYIVDSGTLSGTNYEFRWMKWSSGRSEISGYYSLSGVACTTAFGALYRTGTIAPGVSLPSGLFLAGTITSRQVHFASPAGTPAFVWDSDSTGASSLTAIPSVILARPTSVSSLGGYLNYAITGVWE